MTDIQTHVYEVISTGELVWSTKPPEDPDMQYKVEGEHAPFRYHGRQVVAGVNPPTPKPDA